MWNVQIKIKNLKETEQQQQREKYPEIYHLHYPSSSQNEKSVGIFS